MILSHDVTGKSKYSIRLVKQLKQRGKICWGWKFQAQFYGVLCAKNRILLFKSVLISPKFVFRNKHTMVQTNLQRSIMFLNCYECSCTCLMAAALPSFDYSTLLVSVRIFHFLIIVSSSIWHQTPGVYDKLSNDNISLIATR